jgi:hypothetical protein
VHAEKKRGRLCVTCAGGQMQDETKRELFGLNRALPERSERLEGLLRGSCNLWGPQSRRLAGGAPAGL